MRITELKQTVDIPQGVSVTLYQNKITAKGQHGEISRVWNEPRLIVKIENNQVLVSSKNATKNQKKMIATTRAQIRNIINGVKNGNEYKLKIIPGKFSFEIKFQEKSHNSITATKELSEYTSRDEKYLSQ